MGKGFRGVASLLTTQGQYWSRGVYDPSPQNPFTLIGSLPFEPSGCKCGLLLRRGLFLF